MFARDYEIICKDLRGSFVVMAEDEEIGKLEYPSVFSVRAHAQFAEQSYEFRPKGLLSSSSFLFKGEELLATLCLSWKGHIRIDYQGAKPQKLLLKRTSFWGKTFALETEAGQLLLEVELAFRWSKLNYKYSVCLAEQFPESDYELFALLLFVGYGINLFMLQGA